MSAAVLFRRLHNRCTTLSYFDKGAYLRVQENWGRYLICKASAASVRSPVARIGAFQNSICPEADTSMVLCQRRTTLSEISVCVVPPGTKSGALLALRYEI